MWLWRLDLAGEGVIGGRFQEGDEEDGVVLHRGGELGAVIMGSHDFGDGI